LPCEDHPSQDNPHEEDSRLTQVEPSSTQDEPSSPSQVEQETQEETQAQEQPPSPQPQEQDQGDHQEPSTTQDLAQEDGHDQDKPQEEFAGHNGLKRRIKAATKASDLQVDKILGNISKGVSTHRQLALLSTFCGHHAFVSSFEPQKVHEVLGDLDWVNAMEEELECFTRNKVWSLIERPRDHMINVIGTKWVLQNKQDKNGVITRNKPRLVVQGFAQIECMDYEDTFAPVARLGAIRLLLPYALYHDFKLYQMDVKIVFLNGPLKEEAYVAQPSGFEKPSFPN
jgi:hypothetical protein